MPKSTSTLHLASEGIIRYSCVGLAFLFRITVTTCSSLDSKCCQPGERIVSGSHRSHRYPALTQSWLELLLLADTDGDILLDCMPISYLHVTLLKMLHDTRLISECSLDSSISSRVSPLQLVHQSHLGRPCKTILRKPHTPLVFERASNAPCQYNHP